MEYGIFIARCQPFHFGHEHIINEIILDGKKPVVILGDDNKANPKRNPLSYMERVLLISKVYPNECSFMRAYDKEDWSKWFDQIFDKIQEDYGIENVTLYFNNKEADRYGYFECRGKEYRNTFYTDIFKDHGFKMKPVEFVHRSDIHVDADATNIRDSFEDFKHLLDGRVYWQLKEWGW